jgi:hypothetical protein
MALALRFICSPQASWRLYPNTTLPRFPLDDVWSCYISAPFSCLVDSAESRVDVVLQGASTVPHHDSPHRPLDASIRTAWCQELAPRLPASRQAMSDQPVIKHEKSKPRGGLPVTVEVTDGQRLERLCLVDRMGRRWLPGVYTQGSAAHPFLTVYTRHIILRLTSTNRQIFLEGRRSRRCSPKYSPVRCWGSMLISLK